MASPNDHREVRSKRTTDAVGAHVAADAPANKSKDQQTPRRIEITSGTPIGAQACYFSSLSPMAQRFVKPNSLESPFQNPGPDSSHVSSVEAVSFQALIAGAFPRFMIFFRSY
jgi:hypothetical protein